MNPVRKAIAGAVLAGTALAGGALGAALTNGSASAQTSTSSTTPAAASQPDRPPGAPGGHVGANGATEVPLTGTTADKVRAAAQAAVPGGTIQRVETDAEGSPYEAHMLNSAGAPVTVKVDANFKVTSVEKCAGGGRHGPPPAAAPASA
jgi:hypothetical protein